MQHTDYNVQFQMVNMKTQGEELWSHHCLMVDLNDFISSMDLLTAVSQGLEHTEMQRH